MDLRYSVVGNDGGCLVVGGCEARANERGNQGEMGNLDYSGRVE